MSQPWPRTVSEQRKLVAPEKGDLRTIRAEVGWLGGSVGSVGWDGR